MSTDDLPDKSLTASTETYPQRDEYWEARRRLARACRELGNNLLSRDSHVDDLQQLTADIEALNEQLSSREAIPGRKVWFEESRHSDEDGLALEVSPLIGKSSLVGPELKIWIKDGVARAGVNFDWRFEGPLMCAHGGYIAAVFDEFLGWAQALSGGTGATKNLSVTYHKPTPLNTDLELRAEFVSLEGRKVRLTAEMWAGDVMTASCDGLFISFGDKGTTELHQDL